MHFFRIVAAALGLAILGCGPAGAADTTLRYASDESPEDSLVIEQDSSGNVRAEQGNGQALIVRDGVTYVVLPRGPAGRTIATLDDLVAVGAELRAQLQASGALTDGDDGRYELRELGPEQVGPWQGTGFEIGPVEAPGVSQEVVVSTDPALAEPGRLAVMAFQGLDRMAGAVLIFPPDFTRLVREVLGRGAPIRVDRLTLRSVSADAIAAGRFDLPEPALGRDALRERLLSQ